MLNECSLIQKKLMKKNGYKEIGKEVFSEKYHAIFYEKTL